MPEILERMLRAARLDPGLIDDLESDPGSLTQAFLVAALAAVAGAVGAAGMGGVVVIPLVLVAGVVAWLLFAALAWVLGTKLLHEPTTSAEFGDVVRALGFAVAPGVVAVLGILPVIGRVAGPVAHLWTLAASVVLLRRVLGYSGYGRAVGVILVTWLIAYGLVFAGVMMTPAGAIFTAPDAAPPPVAG